MTNRLAGETSPYLLQHAENPVDWYPWGSEAFERAKREDKPVLLSVGYAACHWCHVMAHESFENEQVAKLMNELFVNIKVDREERPDIDSIYMQAVQAMTGHGGWPMTVFLTPQGEPFFGGTYYPPTDRHGMPGFPRVLRTLADAYRTQPEAIRSTTSQLQELFSARANVSGHNAAFDAESMLRAAAELTGNYDRVHGGFGGAPKFPPSMSLEFLLGLWSRTEKDELLDVVLKSFLAMSRGGIFDQLGGGLHRYSVDDRWLVPHFEKMLYDNALFLRLGTHLWQATKNSEVKEACAATVGWIAREMTSPEGGFYSALDADSEGHEGLFYLWSLQEIERLLGADAGLATNVWGVTRAGNFEGQNILYASKTIEAAAREGALAVDEAARKLSQVRERLLAARSNRVWPLVDDKVIASWNGLMLRALADYARVFGDELAKGLAIANGDFIAKNMLRDGRVLRSWRKGKALTVGFLEDQAGVALAFLDLFSLTGDKSNLDSARKIAQSTFEDFYDSASGLFFDTPHDHESLVTRPRDFSDNATPSGNSLAAELFLRLAVLDSREDYRELGLGVIGQNAEAMERFPQAFGHLLCTADMAVYGAIEVVLAGDGNDAIARLGKVLHSTYLPSLVYLGVAAAGDDATALGAGKAASSGGAVRAGVPVAYVCRGHVCDAPTSDPDELGRQLLAARRSH